LFYVAQLVLLRGLEAAFKFQLAMPEENRKWSRIVLFAENTSSITNEKPGSSQPISQRFMKASTTCLDENREASIEVPWVTGHMDLGGNDRSDKIAKGMTEFEPATETATVVKPHRQLPDNMTVGWVAELATDR